MEVPASLDDLLPSTAPRDRGETVTPAPEPPAPETRAPTTPQTFARPRDLSTPEIAEIEHLHAEVTAASGASERSTFGGRSRKRLRIALRTEEQALGRLGFSSYAHFVAATRPGANPAQPPGEEAWAVSEPVAPRARSFATLADLNARAQEDADPAAAPEDGAAEPRPETEPETDVGGGAAPEAGGEAQVDVDRESAEEETAAGVERGPDQAAVELVQVQGELERVRVELAFAQAAAAEAEKAKRRLYEADVELERLRAELADVTTARFTDESELDRVRADAAAELERVRSHADAELVELASRLTAFQNETARAAEASARSHREELERVSIELQAARDLSANAGAEVVDAIRSRDAAIDELARYRSELDKVRGELGAARAEAARMQQTSEVALARAAEAEAALGSAHEDSRQEIVRLNSLTTQQEAELAGLRARLGEAATDASAGAAVRRELAQARDDLDVARREFASIQELSDRLTGELEAARLDLDAAHRQLENSRAESESRRAEWDSARTEAGLMRAEVAGLQRVIEELERRPPPAAPTPPPEPVSPAPAPARAADGPTEDLRRLVQVAKELAEGTESGGRPRSDAQDELSDLEARVAQLRKKRRQMKRRLERERTELREERDALSREVRNAEVARDRIRQETETLAARIAAEAASVLDEAVHERHEAQLARQAAIEHAGAELAALEAGVDTVVIDASALRVKLASIRADLLQGTIPRPD